jgi:GTP 3',8-cyclase
VIPAVGQTMQPAPSTSDRRSPIQATPVRDGFGRTIDYLRISLTDRCNLRCVYCMPTHGLTFEPTSSLLSAAEIEIVARAAADLGFRKIRLTGGEPTLRADLLEIVAALAAISSLEDLSMTTNGIRLAELAPSLKAAGLRRVNVHIDTLSETTLPRIMRWGKRSDLWAGLLAADDARLTPIKINVVVVRGLNDDEVVDMARLSLDREWTVRFIELMPLGSGEEAQVAVDRFVPNSEVAMRIADELGPLVPVANSDPSDEARNFQVAGAPGRVGFISPVSAPYCGTCNRMRLTAEGKLHLCLLHDDEIDLRWAVRQGGRDGVERELRRAIAAKPSGHDLNVGVHTLHRRMHALGG